MMLKPISMMNMCTVLPMPGDHIEFRVNMLRREITVEFLLDIHDQRLNHGGPKAPHLGKEDRQDRFRFRIPFSQLEAIHRVDAKKGELVLLFTLETPPKFFKKLDSGLTHDDDGRYWTENDAWYRQTDVVYTQNVLKKSPLTLKKTRPIIDLGKSSFFHHSKRPSYLFARTLDYISHDVQAIRRQGHSIQHDSPSFAGLQY